MNNQDRIQAWIRLLVTRAQQQPRTSAAIAATLTLAALAWIAWPTAKTPASPLDWHTVQRGDFLVSIIEGGTLKALHEVTVRSELEGVAKILSIVPEGTNVQMGDLLIELDSSDLRDRVNAQEVVYENTKFSYVQAKESLAIQQSVIESNIKDYELRVEFAQTDLEKYKEGDWPQMLKNVDARTTIAREETERAKERFKWTQELHAKGYATKSELEADSLTVKRKEIEVSQAEEEKRLLTKYDYPKRVRQLEANLDQARKELERLRRRSESQIAQLDASLKSQSNTLDLQEKRLNELKDQLKLTKIIAPQDGLVVYASSSSPGSGTLIEEGATVRQKQDIIKLPDVSQMLLEVRVHESHVQQIAPGLQAWVTIDSLHDQRFRGTVRKVAVLPDSTSRYFNPNLKVYTTEVLIEDELPDIKPGVSGRAEIIITNIADVLTVPIQAVTTIKGQQVCLVGNHSTPTPVPVEVGLFNDRVIEIKSGLKAGERVLLAPAASGDEIDLSGSIVGNDTNNSASKPSAAPAKTAASQKKTNRSKRTQELNPTNPPTTAAKSPPAPTTPTQTTQTTEPRPTAPPRYLSSSNPPPALK
jgi:HlyD family secretion protein